MMIKRFFLGLGLVALVSACTVEEPESTRYKGDKPVIQNEPGTQIYRITSERSDQLRYRFLDAVNAVRKADGKGAVTLSPELIAAARTHSRDMFVQNRPWHFGSDGSSPFDRVSRTRYTGSLVGENIAETFEDGDNILGAWLDQPESRAVILDNRIRKVGIGWHQESNGKIWWTFLAGT